jgi:hypothetical protein
VPGGRDGELGRRPNDTAFMETYLFNSNKVFATFQP